MPLYRAQTVIHTVDNIAANYATNTTYWVDADDSQLGDITLALKDSYDAMAVEWSELMAQNGHEVKYYDMEDAEPRAPILQDTFNLASAPSGSPLPTEVSLCVSFQGPKQSGIPQARRRGRNYLPFLDTGTIQLDGRPDAGVITNAIAWGQNLLDFSQTGGAPTWVVNSTYGEPLEFTTVVTEGWVDNEFDTQRRRGRPATARSVFN